MQNFYFSYMFLCFMVSVIFEDKKDWERAQDLIEEENSKTNVERITFKIEPEEKKALKEFIKNNPKYNGYTDLIIKSLREKVTLDKMNKTVEKISPSNEIEARFLSTFGIHRKVGEVIQEKALKLENEFNKIAELVKKEGGNLDREYLWELLQKYQIYSMIISSVLFGTSD